MVERDEAMVKMHSLQAGFVAISLAVREMYQMITMGGDASLEAKDTIDPFSEGIVFMVGDISIVTRRDLFSIFEKCPIVKISLSNHLRNR